MLNVLTVIADGLAYGMLLFLFSIGLSITLGLMRFINLAHGAFAMCGGYVATSLLNDAGVPFLATLPLAFLITGAIGFVLERGIIRFMYREAALQQVLFSIGLAFAAGAVATIVFGPQQQPITLPAFLSTRVDTLSVPIGSYRIFLILVGAIAAVLMIALFNHTLFGARIRAAVDNRRAAEGIGIKVDRLFAVTFALGAAMAGLGGALAVDFLGLDPTFPFKYLAIVLMIVVLGGAGSIAGSLAAAIFLGVVDALFKYFVPEVGPFVIYGFLVLILIVLPQGLAGRRA
jgi:branched-chain amino acid transport system permease protein